MLAVTGTQALYFPLAQETMEMGESCHLPVNFP
jgi:hypothetical protein